MYKYEYIKEQRETKGISTVKMAKLFGMDCGNYCKLERGKYKNIPIEVLPKLCDILDIDLYYLFNMENGSIRKEKE